ncbi:DnaJ domain-containing protein [Sporocytophaga myxococcoides]|uniref:DnaJ domain-containing protein n=1 Tax=Sporocytophaga myxococcoides TaxID=153721 RepID=A0A098LEG2_9BACT|nr:J domain-containing protein [Sporocytophaga myxococcoides]GAL84673.1 DnaJ domain-containing protein [Sporocytophaga myxococcoides]
MGDILKIDGNLEGGESLSKEQNSFNKKVKEIKSLKKELEELSAALEIAQLEFKKKVIPLQNDFIGLTKERLRILADYYWNKKLSKALKRDLLEVLITECQSLIAYGDSDEEVRKWLDEFEIQMNAGYTKEERKAEAEFDEAFNNFFDGFLGDEEGNGFVDEGSYQNAGQKKKAAKQAAKEEVRKRSIKEIYRGLIKVFHPDKEMDEGAKMEKEEISKEITKAYKKNDLLALLEFETSLLISDKARIREIADDKLKVYNEVLTEQKKDLEHNLHLLKIKNEVVYRGMCMKNSNKQKFLRKVTNELSERNDALVHQMFVLQNDKNYLKYFIASYLGGYDEFMD